MKNTFTGAGACGAEILRGIIAGRMERHQLAALWDDLCKRFPDVSVIDSDREKFASYPDAASYFVRKNSLHLLGLDEIEMDDPNRYRRVSIDFRKLVYRFRKGL